jgi:regulator of replication initiation timing
MNRSILIVICDFLLLSLLTFSTDVNHMADEDTRPPVKPAVTVNIAANNGNDLVNVMKLALTEEQKNREQLQQQLTAVRAASTDQQTQLTEREKENAQLQQQFTAAQANIQNLTRQLQNTSAQAQQQSATAEALRRQLDELAKHNQAVRTQNQQLTNQLLLAQVETRAANEKAAFMQQEAQAARAENARLSEEFKTLATNSTQLVQEIRANTALAPNTIFNGFVSNRVEAAISAWRNGLFMMDTRANKKTETVLVTDGTNFFALCHVQDTPLTLGDPGTDWDKLTGTLTWNGAQVPVRSLSFDAADPRVVMIPVSPADARKLGSKVYRFSSDPYKFQDAVLVGASGDYYGECDFQIEPSTPQYVKLDRSLLRGLFGHFNPSRGDLVFSRTGELLGIMVNNTYCLMIRNFAAAATFPFNQDLSSRHTSGTLSQLYDYLFQLPQRLQ